MVVVADTSALLCRYLPDARRRFVADVMAAEERWVVSALARTEVLLALHQAAGESRGQRAMWDRVRSDWQLFWEVPLDGRCMARAAEVGARYGLSVVDAVHLAAADRLPGPVDYLTLDRRQIPAAADLGFRVRSPAA
ncbi:MAG: type II toxin-antitoxin system VapC family toxin [Actinomycetota bacterium]